MSATIPTVYEGLLAICNSMTHLIESRQKLLYYNYLIMLPEVKATYLENLTFVQMLSRPKGWEPKLHHRLNYIHVDFSSLTLTLLLSLSLSLSLSLW